MHVVVAFRAEQSAFFVAVRHRPWYLDEVRPHTEIRTLVRPGATEPFPAILFPGMAKVDNVPIPCHLEATTRSVGASVRYKSRLSRGA